MNFLKNFIIGSSFPVFAPFYLAVLSLNPEKRNYTYQLYTFIAPIYLGLMNMLSAYISREYNLGLRSRLLITSIISTLIVSTFSTVTKAYNYQSGDWIKYYLSIFVQHFFIYNIVIYSLETLTQ